MTAKNHQQLVLSQLYKPLSQNRNTSSKERVGQAVDALSPRSKAALIKTQNYINKTGGKHYTTAHTQPDVPHHKISLTKPSG